MPILPSDKIEFKKINVTRDKEEHFLKGSITSERYTSYKCTYT